MAIVYIEEVGGSIRICSKQATADALGIESADLDVNGLTHPASCYTLTAGVITMIQANADTYDADLEQVWCKSELAFADIQIAYLIDGDVRQSPPPSDWYAYRKDLRNRVTGGLIIGDPTNAGRPPRPVIT
jgi:hypothetical protein